jgi:ribosomal protein L11 methyltransferase
MNQYKEFRIDATPYNVDIISSLLWELEITGITENDTFLLVYADENSETDKEVISGQLEKLVKNNLLEIFNVTETRVENQNWNEEWEKTINVIEISDRIVVKPSFKNYDVKPGQLILHIDPKMSFGTGEHETTKLMLLLSEKYTEQGMKVLDVGTGTGVLAICAVKLGASKALAIDNDEWCKLNGEENIERNDLRDKIEIRHCEINDVQENEFDLVMANINRNILLEIIPTLSEKTKSKGIIILSGLLREDEQIITESCLRYELQFKENLFMNEWAALVFIKK